MKLIARIKLNLEGFKFGLKKGFELGKTNPFITKEQAKIECQVCWVEHLLNTDRGEFVPESARTALTTYRRAQKAPKQNTAAFTAAFNYHMSVATQKLLKSTNNLN